MNLIDTLLLLVAAIAFGLRMWRTRRITFEDWWGDGPPLVRLNHVLFAITVVALGLLAYRLFN